MSSHPSIIPTGQPEPFKSTQNHLISASINAKTQVSSNPEPVFNRSRHITYWLRCARTFLPNPYESGDASRMLFSFFIVSALDLLGLLDKDPNSGLAKVTDAEKQGWIEWIYHCQHRTGGFRGFTGTMMDEKESAWDPANLPATFFALCTLLMLGDDLERVNREACLRWIMQLQRDDGSFGEVLSSEPGSEAFKIEGGKDLRLCCCAAGILYVLRDVNASGDATSHSQLDAMLGYIKSCQSYEGGFSEGPYREAHSGLNYCAIGAASFADSLACSKHKPPGTGTSGPALGGYIDFGACTRWMLERQTTYIEEENDDSDEEEHMNGSVDSSTHMKSQYGSISPEALLFAGFNGRTNKVADTCYTFWNMGALTILEKQHFIDQDRLRRYLLQKVQHAIGGFGKGVDEPPDVLHAYLGLATLSILGKDGLKPIDATLCMSTDATERIGKLSWKKSVL